MVSRGTHVCRLSKSEESGIVFGLDSSMLLLERRQVSDIN